MAVELAYSCHCRSPLPPRPAAAVIADKGHEKSQYGVLIIKIRVADNQKNGLGHGSRNNGALHACACHRLQWQRTHRGRHWQYASRRVQSTASQGPALFGCRLLPQLDKTERSRKARHDLSVRTEKNNSSDVHITNLKCRRNRVGRSARVRGETRALSGPAR